MVDGVRNAKSLSFQRKVSCVRSITTVSQLKTFFISQSGDFIKTQEFSQTPGQEDRLMTNATIDWDKKVAPSAIYEEGAVVFPVLHGPMGEDGSVQGFLEVFETAFTLVAHLVI